MQAVQDALNRTLAALPRLPYKEALDAHVTEVLASLKQNGPPEIRRTQWEFVLRQEIFTLASTEGQALKDPSTTYYDDLTRRLDLILAFTDKDACDHIFPFNVLYDLLETQTIASCSHIFSWIELRAGKLTEGMIPQKGKALVLLRTLNDLLRRLSKVGSTTLFCGRILTFLSQVFPLGERSGVNLRGEYGPEWDGPGANQWRQPLGESTSQPETKMVVDEASVEETSTATAEEKESKLGDAMAVDEKQREDDDFYNTFWSLQLPFSNPWIFRQKGSMAKYQEAVNKVLPVIKEATAKERALMGSKVNANSTSLKRRREPEFGTEAAGQDYFFAKYLTSPELLDLEVADTHFRRQFLFQLLIQLHHLLTLTVSARVTWQTSRNRSLQIDFAPTAEDAQWAQDIINKVSEELRQTTPSGRAFAETVHTILEREKNWVKWKNDLCAPFDKEPWREEIEVEMDGIFQKTKVSVEEATRSSRKKRREEPKDWVHELGAESLTEIWTMGYRDLSDLEIPFRPGEVQDFVKKIKLEDAKIDNRKKQLARAAERIAQAKAKAAAASVAASPTPMTASAASVENAPAIVPTGPRSALAPSAPPATPPLHPSLPAKPGTASSRPPPALVPEPVPAPIPAPIVAPVPTPAVVPPPVVEVVPPPDDLIMQYEENKQQWSWLALRTARDQYLQHFNKIGTGDVLLLAQEIEKEKAEKEKVLRGELPSAENRDERGASPMVGSTLTIASLASDSKVEDLASGDAPAGTVDTESKEVKEETSDTVGDVKMDS